MRKTISNIAACLGSVLEMIDSQTESNTQKESLILDELSSYSNLIVEPEDINTWLSKRFQDFIPNSDYEGKSAIFRYREGQYLKHIIIISRDRDFIYYFDPESPKIQKITISWLREVSNKPDFVCFDLSFLELNFNTNLYKNSKIVIHSGDSANYDANALYEGMVAKGDTVQTASYQDVEIDRGRVIINGSIAKPGDYLLLFLDKQNPDRFLFYQKLIPFENVFKYMARPSSLLLFDDTSLLDIKRNTQGSIGAMRKAQSYRPMSTKYIFWIVDRKLAGAVSMDTGKNGVYVDNEIFENLPKEIVDNAQKKMSQMINEGINHGSISLDRFGITNDVTHSTWPLLSFLIAKGKGDVFFNLLYERFKKQRAIHY